MKAAAPLLVALASITACDLAAAAACTPLVPATAAQDRPSFAQETATVEDVIATSQDGYRSRAYVVTWHGFRVLVSDPLAETHKNVGDSIDFIASHYVVNGNRILSFISTEDEPRQRHASSGSSDLRASSSIETGIVEEVLSAQDSGFRFVAYIVRSQDQRIAASDPLALSHHVIGEQIDYLALRAVSYGEGLADFQVDLSAAEKASVSKPLCGIQSSSETGIVDQALSVDDGGYQYRAYIIEWRGSQVVIEDPTAATNYQAGDAVSFWVSRFELPPADSHKQQDFTFDRPENKTRVNQPADFQQSTTMDSAPIRAVLVSNLDGYRSVAYLVNWHNAPVAIVDAFATTHFRAGDPITFSVSHTATAGMKELDFMLFDFPSRRCARHQSSSADGAQAQTTKTPASGCHR